MTHVSPCREKNAIQVVALAVELKEELTATDIKKIKEIYESTPTLNEDLVRAEDLTSYTIQLDQKSNQSVSLSNATGVTFDRLNARGEPEWSITFRGQRVFVVCSVYTSWAEIKPNAIKYFRIFQSVLRANTVMNLVLEYLDRFDISDIRGNWQIELFNGDSKFIPKKIFDLIGVWHNHQGYLEESSLASVENVLNKVEFDITVDKSGKYSVFIKTHHRCKLKDPAKFSDLYEGEIFNNIIDFAHDENKVLMRDILSEEIQFRIGLKKFSGDV